MGSGYLGSPSSKPAGCWRPVPRGLVDRRSKDNRRGAAQFAAELEEAWKAQLRGDGDEHRFREISVSSREFLLGDGGPLS